MFSNIPRKFHHIGKIFKSLFFNPFIFIFLILIPLLILLLKNGTPPTEGSPTPTPPVSLSLSQSPSTILPSLSPLPSEISPVASLSPVLSPSIDPSASPSPSMSVPPTISLAMSSSPTEPQTTTSTPTPPCTNPELSGIPSPVVLGGSPCSGDGTLPTLPTPDPNAYQGWAGYVYPMPANIAVAKLHAEWNVSTINCMQDGKPVTDGDNNSEWIGMGGYLQDDTNMPRLGTGAQCNSGAAEYYSFTWPYPQNVTNYFQYLYPQYQVVPGDQISATLTYQGDSKYTATLTNETKRWSLSIPMTYESADAPKTGEVAYEHAQDQNTPWANMKFNPPVIFTQNTYSYTGQSEQPLEKAKGLIKTEIVNVSGVRNTSTSPITNNTFFVSWLSY